MGVKKSYFKGIFFKYLIFVILLAVIIPIISSLSLEGQNIISKIMTSFSLQKFNLLIVTSVGVFLLLASSKLKTNFRNKWKPTILLMIVSLFFLTLSIVPFYNFNYYLSEGIHIEATQNQNEEQMFLDKNKWLNLKLIESKDKTSQIFIGGKDYNDKELKKDVYLTSIPKNPSIKWFGSWKGSLFNDNVFNPNINVFMTVNNQKYNITNQYKTLLEYNKGWLELNVSNKDLKIGRNELIIFSENNGGIGEDIGIATQKLFVNNKSFVLNENEFISLEEEFIWYIKTNNSFAYKSLFKLGFIFRILSIITLFLAVFGITFTKRIFKVTKKEMFFSFIWIYLLGLFSVFAKEISSFLAQITTFSIYFLLKITGFTANITLNAVQSSIMLGDYQASVELNSSGAIYMIYFLIVFTILVLFKWKEFQFKKVLLFNILGLIGVFLLNTINLYILTLIGNYKPAILDTMTKFLPDIFTIIFFIIFWPLFLKFSEKKKRK